MFGKKIIYTSIALFLSFSVYSQDKEATDKLLRIWAGNATCSIPVISENEAPKIDGVLNDNEWRKSVKFAGFLKNGKLVAGQRGFVYLNTDKKNLYVGVVTSTPDNDPGGGLCSKCKDHDGAVYSDDSVEILINPDNDPNTTYQIILNSNDAVFDQKITYEPKKNDISWNIKNMLVASRTESGWWKLELKIPLSEIGSPKKSVRLNIVRNWQEIGSSAINATRVNWDRDKMISASMDSNAPLIKMNNLGATEEGAWDVKLHIENPSSKKYVTAAMLRNYSWPKINGKVTRKMDIDRSVFQTVSPNSKQDFSMTADVDKKKRWLSLVVYEADTKKVVFSRLLNGQKEISTGSRQPYSAIFELKKLGNGVCWYYPGYNRAAIKINIKSSVKVESLSVSVKGKDGKNNLVKAVRKRNYYRALVPVGKSAGSYQVNITVKEEAKPERTFEAVCKLEKRLFAWENNSYGKDKIILPPFTPINADKNRITLLMREHLMNGTGLWDSLKVQDKEILTGPMRWEMVVDGKKQTWNSKISKPQIEYSGYDVKMTAEAQSASGIKLKTDLNFEYDGFFWSKVKLQNTANKSIDKLTLIIPVKNSEAKMFHAVSNTTRTNPAGNIPSGNGEVWNGTKLVRALIFGQENIHPQIVPYIWLGGIERGLCWFMDSSFGYKLDRKKSAVRIIRRGDTVFLEVDIINKTVQLKDGHSFEFGMQATPVKPVDASWRKLFYDSAGNGVAGMQNSMTVSWLLLGYPLNWSKLPYNEDFRLLNQVSGIIRQGRHLDAGKLAALQIDKDDSAIKKMFLKIKPLAKSWAWFKKCRNNFYRIQLQNPKLAPSLPYKYSDPRLTYTSEKIPQYFKSEWWSPQPQAYFGAWRTYPVPSNLDYIIYGYYQELKNGMHGIYLDDVYLMPNPNPDTAARIDETGEVHSEIGILALRQLVKRIAVMQHQFKRYPRILQVHMTNSLLVPCFSFATSQLGWESKFGETPFQERYKLDSIQAINTGRQIGADSLALAGILRKTSSRNEWKQKQLRLTRTLLSMLLPHGVKPWIRIMPEADWDEVRRVYGILSAFGYSQKNCRFVPYWQDNPAIIVDNPNIIISSYSLPGKTLAIVSNMKKDIAKIKFNVDKQKLGLPEKAPVIDIESKENVNSGLLSLGAYDFKLIQIGK